MIKYSICSSHCVCGIIVHNMRGKNNAGSLAIHRPKSFLPVLFITITSFCLLIVFFLWRQPPQHSNAVTLSYGPGTYNNISIPARAINITAEIWGGGGAGGGAASGLYGGGGGGGSGGYIKKNFGHSQAASTINISVGGGAPRTPTGNNNGAGGGASSASFGGTAITANGGNGGGVRRIRDCKRGGGAERRYGVAQ